MVPSTAVGEVLDSQKDYVLLLGGGNCMGSVGGNVDQRPLGRDKIMAVDAAMERPLEDEIELFVRVRVHSRPGALGLLDIADEHAFPLDDAVGGEYPVPGDKPDLSS